MKRFFWWAFVTILLSCSAFMIGAALFSNRNDGPFALFLSTLVGVPAVAIYIEKLRSKKPKEFLIWHIVTKD